METIVITSKCSEEEKIQYSALMFKGEAHEWWNALLMSKGRDVMYGLSWDEFKAMVMGKFCPMHETDQIQTKFLNHKVVGTNLREYNTKFLEYCRLVPQLVSPESSKVTRYIWGLPREIHDMVKSHLPQTVDSAMELAGYLMGGLDCNKEEDKKVTPTTAQGKMGGSANFKGKGANQSRFNTNSTFCKTCRRYHKGRCNFSSPPKVCESCNRTGHDAVNCWKKIMTCFNCKEMGHLSFECPKNKPAAGGAGGSGQNRKGNARVFVLDTKRAADVPETITGTFLVNDTYARVLFDYGANLSFIDNSFCSLLNEPLIKLNKTLSVETASGEIVKISEALENEKNHLAGYILPICLLPMSLAGFDIVLGMDWLSDNHARIICNNKTIEVQAPDKRTIRIEGDKDIGQVIIISMIRANKCLNQGCLAFMAYVTEESKPKEIKSVPVDSDFSNVFLDELPGIPPDREVEFRIDLILGTAPIAKAPYLLAPTEMKELKKQLDELLEKRFHSTEFVALGSSNSIRQEEGRIHAYVYRLSCVKQSHNQKPISTPSNR
ncbi:uncharacterized protein LOC143624232 [Bidens hawaiensis]|uniref:uncharacterized protein LOC143624232 n=1 Tax=Bidens hawaiensis TaxID=980011 RepID=UPI00404B83BB